MPRRKKQPEPQLSPQQKGGRAVAQKYAPPYCPRCGKEFVFCAPWMAYLGHLRMHQIADRHFGGDLQAAQKRLRENGLARQEEKASWSNGAFRPYRPIAQYSFPPQLFQGEAVQP